MRLPSISRNNEVFNEDGSPRGPYSEMVQILGEVGLDGFRRQTSQACMQAEIDSFTFPLDPLRWRMVPTDWVPRTIPKDHWAKISAGVEQTWFRREALGEEEIMRRFVQQ